MLEWLMFVAYTIRCWFIPRHKLIVENLALRSQLSLFEYQASSGKRKKPRATPAFRQLWVILPRCIVGWQSALVIFKPETVIGWHRTAFRLYWRHKSRRKHGRPAVSVELRRLIKKIYADNPLWSPERIYDQLINLGFDPPSPNTIRKYLPKHTRNAGGSSQTWKTFIANHMNTTWAMDFFIVPTLTFRLLYVFIVVSHERREVVRFGITRHPTMLWVIQQLREATDFGVQPRYIIRDNDSIYGSGVPAFLKNSGIQEVRTAFRSPWQNPYTERVIGTLRRELLDHVIPLNEQHLHSLLKEYISRYYHPVRTHNSLDHKPPVIDLSAKKRWLSLDCVLESEPILGGLYTNYQVKAA